MNLSYIESKLHEYLDAISVLAGVRDVIFFPEEKKRQLRAALSLDFLPIKPVRRHPFAG